MDLDSSRDKAGGRAKEAAGAALDDDELRREGQKDQSKGKLKDAAKKAGDAAKGVGQDLKDAASKARR